MYQSVGHHAIDLYAEAMDLPLYRREIQGTSIETGVNYKKNSADEVEDLYELLKEVKEECGIEAVSVGAILSDYQRVRVENVCSRLGLTSLAYLWRRDQEELFNEMIHCGINAILIKVAALGLDPKKHLGKSLAEMQSHLLKMETQFGLNVCGEGGEYETFTLDCPLFKKRLVLEESETVVHSDDAFAQVAYLNLKRVRLEDKADVPECMSERVAGLPMLRGSQLEAPEYAESEEVQLVERPTVQPENNFVGGEVWCCKESSGHFSICGIKAFSQRSPDGEVELEIAMQEAMEKLTGLVAELKAEISDITAVHLYVSNMASFSRMNNIYKQYFSSNPPIRVCVESCLPENLYLIMDVQGFSPVCAIQQSTMHVQGLSHWAPANIGPYSQAKRFGDLVYVAGQIGMRPSDLQLVRGGIAAQSALSLRHVSRVLAAMHPSLTCTSILLSVCYVTNHAYIACAREQWNKTQEGNCDTLVCFVVVPALPKSALVEWQVYAGLKYATRGNCISCREDGWQAVAEYTVMFGQPSSCSLCITIEADSLHDIDVSRAMRLSLEAVRKVWQAAAEQLADLAAADTDGDDEDEAETSKQANFTRSTLRMFYRQDSVSMEELYTAYESHADHVLGASPPAPAMVPALAFLNDKTLMMITA